MNVSVETTSSLGRKLTIVIPAAKVAAKRQEKMKSTANTMKIDGFRKGKVPISFIQKKYGKQVHAEVVSDLINDSLREAFEQEKLSPVEMPLIEEVKDISGEDFQYVAKFEIFPEILLGDFKAIELEKLVADITDADIDQNIARLQNQLATWTVADKKAVNGDQLIIDFVGSIDGIPFKNGAGTEVPLELGSNKFIPGFEEKLQGVSAGDLKTIDVTFPAEYNAVDLAGKLAQFDVKIHSVASKELPLLNEEFAKKIGVEDGDISQIRDKVKTNLIVIAENIVKEGLKSQAMEKLIANNKFDIPVALLEKEKKVLLEKNAPNGSASEFTPAQLDEEAAKRVSLGLLLNKIIAQYNIKPEKARIDAKIRELSAMLGGNMDLIQRIYRESNELLDQLRSSILTDQAIELVIEYATINDKSSTFDNIANRST